MAKSRSLSTRTAGWAAGDEVLVDQHKDGSVLLWGVIEEVRGSGWFSVRLKDSSEPQKFRGTQLKEPGNQNQMSSMQKDEKDKQSKDITSFLSSGLPQAQMQAPPPLTAQIDVEPKYSIDPSSPPPPPTIVDLDAFLMENSADASEQHQSSELFQQLSHHSSITQWVVFTDLHCAPSSLKTSLQVLRTVHQLARERENAGVLFLGDFWHHRGTLRVDCLNAVLQELRNWTVPMVLIPGNHDQVTLGGHSHGLTPLEYSYRVRAQENKDTTVPGPLVFSHPTIFAGALFVPHIRDIATLESILQSNAAKNAEAIFVHADVTGAYMNDLIVSTGGIHPSVFPANKPIYSGHFHKPHIVTHKNNEIEIEYLGSPYETSLAEAEQPKALAVLDASRGWKSVERLPLSIGRKHFKPKSVTELTKLSMDPKDSSSDVLLKAGDRVVLTLPRNERGLDTQSETHIRQLRKAGVTVEVREEALDINNVEPMGSQNILDFEDLSPANTWDHFWKEQVKRSVIETSQATTLCKAGMELMEELESPEESNESSSQNFAAPFLQQSTDLQLDSVNIEGYGPFTNAVSYPLNGRGLVLLRGNNRDGGSDSNGSGKTSLSMAALWALTGSADPRPFQDSKVADVVNDSKDVSTNY